MPFAFIRFLALPAALAAVSAHAQIIDTEDDAVAGIPVNYTEAKTGSYSLPDPLKLDSGQRVSSPEQWFAERRPQLLERLENQQFGKAPAEPAELRFEITDRGTSAFEGKALRKQVTLFLTPDDAHYIDLLIYLPANATGPVPSLLQVGWGPNNLQVDDPGVKVGRAWDRETRERVAAETGRRFGRGLTVLPLIERGYGTAVFNYSDIDPDSLDGFPQGVRNAFLAAGQTKPASDEWGAIAAWAWGISRIVDYLETDPSFDPQKIAVTGASRLGKTVLWAGARDQRIACVIASISGEGGAALSRRNYGETVAHLVAPERYPYQFAANYRNWANRFDEAPFDSHFLLSLIAPRPLLLQTGSTDKWSDPYGEFLAAKAATPVYAFLGADGIEPYSMPAAGEALNTTLGYVMHEGGHGVYPEDWDAFLAFLEIHLKSNKE